MCIRDREYLYKGGIFNNCNHSRSRIVFLDPEIEFKKIYPDYDTPSLGPGEAIIVPGKDSSYWNQTQSVNLDINLTDEFIMQIMYQEILKFRDLKIFGKITVNNLATEIRRNAKDTRIFQFRQNLKVTYVGEMIPTFGSKNTFFVLLNKKHFFEEYMAQIKKNNISDEFNFLEGNTKYTVNLLEQLKKSDKDQISNAIIMNLKDRMSIYLNDSFKSIQSNVLPKANKILEILDITDMVYTSTPIINQLDSLKYVVPFMKITVNTLISFLLLLNFTLIYHIFGLSLQDKLFHFGIMRTLGFQRNSLYFVLFAQGLFLSTITFIIAFPLTYLLFALFNSMDLQIQLFENDIYPSFGNIILTCFLNFLIPQISLLIPGYKFFSKKIMESIDNRAELFSSLKISNNKSSNIFSKLFSNLIFRKSHEFCHLHSGNWNCFIFNLPPGFFERRSGLTGHSLALAFGSCHCWTFSLFQ